MHEVVRFVFPEAGCREGIEADIALAIFSAECLYGRPRTRLEVSYLVDGEGRRCVLRARGEAGETALKVFLGLCGARFGEEGFQVTRVAALAEEADGE